MKTFRKTTLIMQFYCAEKNVSGIWAEETVNVDIWM